MSSSPIHDQKKQTLVKITYYEQSQMEFHSCSLVQSQLQERDYEVSFLRDEITRCTGDSLQALKIDKRGLDEIQDILSPPPSPSSGDNDYLEPT
ncbi:hypothetical protein Tco_0354374, partial [Tanacetum coccineum]